MHTKDVGTKVLAHCSGSAAAPVLSWCVTRRALEVSCGPVCQSTGKVLCSLLPMSLFQAPTLGPNNPSTIPIAMYRLRGVLAVMSFGRVRTACVY